MKQESSLPLIAFLWSTTELLEYIPLSKMPFKIPVVTICPN
jgi:hypothetical protein